MKPRPGVRFRPTPVRSNAVRSSVALFAVSVLGFGITGCGRADRVPHLLLAADITDSTDEHRASMATEMEAVASAAITGRGGLGAVFTVARMGGGPADLRLVEVDAVCTDGARKCTDPIVVDQRVEAVSAEISRAVAAPARVGGSDPIGSAFRLLADYAALHHGDLDAVLWTDFFSRSDTLDTAATDLSTPEARTAAIDGLAARGIDFTTIRLDAEDRITVHLVPAEASTASTAYLQQVSAFVEELLSRTGATVVVVLSSALS